jgi:hypothetical protein
MPHDEKRITETWQRTLDLHDSVINKYYRYESIQENINVQTEKILDIVNRLNGSGESDQEKPQS